MFKLILNHAFVKAEVTKVFVRFKPKLHSRSVYVYIVGTLWHAELTENLKIPTVPFLPLEKRHVKQCIIAYLMEKKLYKHPNHIGEDKIQEVLKELSFYPTTEQMFSVTGCKRVRDKVDYIFEEMDI